MASNSPNIDILKQQEPDLDFIINAAELATWDLNPVTNKFKANNKLKEWFGLPPASEIDLQLALDNITEQDRPHVVDAIKKALDFSSGGNYNIAFTLINPVDKTERKVIAKGKAVFNENNLPYRFSGTLQDVTKEKLVLEQIQQSEKRFRNTVHQAPIGITIFHGPDFIIDTANETYLQIIDRKENEFVGRPLFEVLPEVKASVEKLLKGVLETGEPYYGFEFPVTINRYGKAELTYFNFVYQPLRDEQDNVYGIIVIATEVTESVKAKHFLTESEKQFRNLILQSPIPMAILKGKHFIVELANNIMYSRMWRKKPEDVQGKKLLEVFPELSGQKYPELLTKVYNSGKAHREVESIAFVQGDDGLKKFYLDYEYAPLFDTDNTVSGIIITVNDVTEKVDARQKIQDAEERARLANNAGEFGVYELDMKKNELTADNRFFKIFGFTNPVNWDEVKAVIHPDDLHLRKQAHENSLQSGSLEYESRVIKNDASVSWIKIKGLLVFEETMPSRILGIVSDITKQKEFEAALEQKVQERTQELAEANRQLHQSNIELNQFAYIASHDLQEPLRKVRTFIELMQADLGEVSPKAKAYINKIQSSTERMQNLINDVLKFSSLSKEREKFEQVNLNKILSNVTSDYELLIEQKHAVVKTGKLPVIEAIPLQMQQLFTNLISNALKFSDKKRLLEISINAHALSKNDISAYEGLSNHTQYFVIEVKDNGIGFDQANAEQIFTIFQRLHGKSEYEGTGIGLAMCKKIIQNHHGIITAHSHKDEGATFTIILPQIQSN